jgi:hypothetical protein
LLVVVAVVVWRLAVMQVVAGVERVVSVPLRASLLLLAQHTLSQ